MAQEAAWYDAYPKPRNQSPAIVRREELLQWLKDGQKPGVEFLLVDLRLNDHKVR